MKREYKFIKDYYKGLTEEEKEEVLFDLKQLRGLVIDEIQIPDMSDYLVMNIILVLNRFDIILEYKPNDMKEQFELLKLIIKDDVVALQNNNEPTYGEKRTFGEYMNYIYNVVDFIE